MQLLRQSTASQSVLIGPFVDSSDGVTAETGLTIANTDIRLSANGGNMAAKNSGGGTHDEAGWYTVTLDATDTATVGRLQLSVAVAGALPVFAEFQVLEEAVYDSFFAASATNRIAGIDGTIQTLDALDTAQDTQHGTTQGLVSTVDGVADAIKAQTDLLTFTGDSVNANAKYWDETLISSTSPFDAVATAVALATVDANVDSILADTGTTIPAQIAGLNNLSTSDVDARLAAIGLDHLVSAAVTGTDVADNSIVAKLVSSSATADWDDFVNTTDSLQAIRDWTGDGSNLTEAGGTGDHLTAIPWNASWDAEVQSECADALTAFGWTSITISAVSGAVGSVTGNVGGSVASVTGAVGSVTGSVGSLATQAKADVNAEVDDVLNTDATTEPTSAPAATASLGTKIGWVFARLRNKLTQTATTETLFQDDTTTTLSTSTVSDDGTTYTRGEHS